MKITNTLKEKSKEICSFLAYVIAATLITPPLAFAAPSLQMGQGTVNTKFKSTLDSANGCINNGLTCFFANSRDDLDGLLQGDIQVLNLSSGSFSFIACSGTAYAGIVSVNRINGDTIVKATLNPSDPSCLAINWNVGTTTVNLFGRYTDGGFRSSSNSKTTNFSNGTTFRFNNTSDAFEETFTGSITGFSGLWVGSASASRNTNREQVK
jgi:hypothetical protein